MTHFKRELTEAFPGQSALLHQLQADDGHFRTLVNEFDNLADSIGSGTALLDAELEQLKKQRLAVLDKIAAVMTDNGNEGVS
ncbi:hypothetical protein [Sandarakinorhabdus sp.]|uniref:YdcH family protein n=1 Tax=Sandarakinorhabdus sp. TaxID=1916663 RepID=UPI00286E384D|nr:hypothetical protein [Sandarakinorhabdus sp.]